VTRLAREVTAKYRRLDVLINNAAMAAPTGRRVSVDGIELTFQVNYLSHYLLTRLLLQRLTVTGDSRVINLSSILHRTANINWSDPQRTKNYAPVAVYAQSKLAMTMFAQTLSAKEPRLTAISVHPGIVDTDLVSIYARGGAPVADGAGPVAQLVSAPIDRGAYYDQFRAAAHAPLVDNRNALDRLWKLSAALVGLDRSMATSEA
jgi:NAD(P)-dependent dehydrogenase (short-subunit alcohol dehydrogenase family)